MPALNRTVLLIATSSLIFAAKVLPTGSCEEIELSMLTLMIVPAGIIAAVKDEATKQAQHVAINTIFFFVSYWFGGRSAYEEVLKADCEKRIKAKKTRPLSRLLCALQFERNHRRAPAKVFRGRTRARLAREGRLDRQDRARGEQVIAWVTTGAVKSRWNRLESIRIKNLNCFH
jgi:hypothetical protein